MGLGRSRDTTRALQIGFVALLAICVAQVGWWYLDQVRFTAQTQDRLMTAYRTEVAFAERLQDQGTDMGRVLSIFPNLVLDAEGALRVSPDLEAGLIDARRRRLNRYRWEAGFFLLVLVGGIWVLWRSLRAYEQLSRRQQTFMAAVSHEFKSPLASLRLSVDSLSRRAPSPERLDRVTHRMGSDLDRLIAMVENLLNTARLEDGRFPIHPEPLSLAEVVTGLVDASRPRGQEKGVEIVADVPLSLRIVADPLVAQTIVQNLLDNALKATLAAGGGEIRLEGERAGSWGVLRVSDTGIGFDPRETRRLFEKFYRPGDAMRRKGGGSGLGLYLVEGLMARSGGWVRGESPGPGAGAVFTVGWPLAASPPTGRGA